MVIRGFPPLRSVLIKAERLLRCDFLFKLTMSSSAASGYTWSIQVVSPEEHHTPINLPHKEIVFLGRSPDTRIVDPRCSRKQVQVMADLKTGEVQATRLGANSSALDGIEMIPNKVYEMKQCSTLFVLTGLYPQKLHVEKLNKESSHHRESSTSRSKTSDDKTKHRENITTSKSSDVKQQKISGRSCDSNSRSTELKVSSSKEKHERADSTSHKNAGHSHNGNSKSIQNKISSTKEKHSSSTSTSSDRSSLPKVKKRSLPEVEVEIPRKKQRLSLNEPSEEGSPIPSHSRKNSDSNNLKFVADKLELLKSSAKKLKTPDKDSNYKHAISKDINDRNSVTKAANVQNISVTESSWSQQDSLYVYVSKGVKHSNMIAGFDIDGTIITTQSGKVFPTHPGDWRLLYHSEAPKKFKILLEKGYKIVFFTNQMGVSRGKSKIEDLQTKFEDVVNDLDVPVQILVSTKGGKYRKPCTGMWEYLTDQGNGGITVDISKSFYVGDAAGRPKDWMPKKKKDFSCSDRLFALNIGLEFKTPEEYFLGYHPAKYSLPDFDPRKLNSKMPLLEPEVSKLTAEKAEMIIFVGSPASGKSHFVKTYLQPKGYTHVNRDTLGSWQKCVTACADSLKRGTSVVVDNTNPDPESRERYISVAKKHHVPCRCFVFNTSLSQARHNERFREMTDRSHQAISDMIMNSYKKKFKYPDIGEGFTEIVKVNCIPKFQDSKLEKLYRMFLLEK